MTVEERANQPEQRGRLAPITKALIVVFCALAVLVVLFPARPLEEVAREFSYAHEGWKQPGLIDLALHRVSNPLWIRHTATNRVNYSYGAMSGELVFVIIVGVGLATASHIMVRRRRGAPTDET